MRGVSVREYHGGASTSLSGKVVCVGVKASNIDSPRRVESSRRCVSPPPPPPREAFARWRREARPPTEYGRRRIFELDVPRKPL
jgi:hypothetical protein